MTSLGLSVRPLFLLALSFVHLESFDDDFSASRWKAKVDPPAAPLAKASSNDFAIPFPANFGGGGEALYPTTPSLFVAIGKNAFQQDSRQVWDLSTKKLVGTFKGQLGYDERSVALSPDGAYLAGKPRVRNAIEVRASKNGRVVQTFDLERPFNDFIDFASNDRLVFGFLSDKRLQVADIKTGDKVCDVNLFERPDREAIAISPGRNYLALGSSTDGMIRVYDLNEGNLVGQVPTPKKNQISIRAAGIAFSPDGSEMAAYFEFIGESRVVCWNAATGKMTGNFDLAKDIQKPPLYKDEALAYLPDSSAWLVYGYAIVDRASGKKVWNLPFDNDNLKASPRRFLDDDHALVITHKQALALRTASIPRDKIAGAIKIIKEGGNAADASLPPLTKGDTLQAKAVDLRNPPQTWAVAPGASGGPEVRLTTRPVLLKGKPDEFRALLFAGPGSSLAVAVGTPQQIGRPNPTDGQPRWVERFDLAAGKSLGKLDLPSVADPIAFGPDGSSLILREANAKDRIDVISSADGKPIAGWRPYDKETAEGKGVVWADFLDRNRVLTLSQGGTLILWAIPSCKAVYVAEDAFMGSPVLSPDRKFLAGFDGRGLRLLDAETGAWKGEGDMPAGITQRTQLKSLAFRPDGLAVAAYFSDRNLVVWGMKNGKLSAQFMVGSPFFADALSWAGNTHVLLGNRTLIDLGTRREVWNFIHGSINRPAGAIGPDGKHWAIIRGVVGQETARLMAFDPIDPALVRAEALLADVNAPCSLRPGSSVSLQINANGPPRDPQVFRQAVTDSIAAKLRGYGMNFNGQGGQPGRPNVNQVSLVRSMAPAAQINLNISEKDINRNLEYRRMGAGRGPVQLVRLVDLVCEITLVDAKGAVVWSESRTVAMEPFGMVLRMPAGENDPESYLKKLQWESAKQWATGVGFPYFVARDGNQIVRLPGVTDLNR